MTKKGKIILSTILSVCMVAALGATLVLMPSSIDDAIAADVSYGMTEEGWAAHQAAFGTGNGSHNSATPHTSGTPLNDMPQEDGTITLTASGIYYLNADLVADIMIKDDVTICLNGYKLTGNGSTHTIDIEYYVGAYTGTLSLVDCCPGSTCVEAAHKHDYSKESTGKYNFTGSGAGTIYGGVITGGNAPGTANYKSWGGGVLVNSTDSFYMYGGTIAGNEAGYGGGVGFQGDFHMCGGTIAGNMARQSAGAIYASTGTQVLTIKDCVIVENTSGSLGAVSVYNTFRVSIGGAIVIKDNSLLDGSAANLYIHVGTEGGGRTGKPLTYVESPVKITSALTGTQVGVTIGDLYPENGAFTSGFMTNNNDDNPSKYFFSDNPEYKVRQTEGGEAYLLYDPILDEPRVEYHVHENGAQFYPLSLLLNDNPSQTLENGYYCLDEDLTGNLTINGNVTLCLNGYKLTGSGNATITVNEECSLTLLDCHEGESSGTVTGSNYGLYVNGIVTMHQGNIVGNSDYDLYVSNSGIITINGGTVNKLSNAGTTVVNGDTTITDTFTSSGTTNVNAGIVQCNIDVTSGSFFLTGGEFGHNISTSAGSTLSVSGSNVDTIVSNGMLNVLDKASVKNVESHSTAMILGGEITKLDTYASTFVSQTASITGTDTCITVHSGVLSVSAGSISGDVEVMTGANFALTGGDFGHNVTVATAAIFTLSGSSVNEVNTQGIVTLSGGSATTVNATAGTVAVKDTAEVATLNANGGEATVSGGTVATLNANVATTLITGGEVGTATVAEDATLNMSNGTATSVTNNGTFAISGGTATTVESNAATTVSDEANVTTLNVNADTTTVSGGTVTTLSANGGTADITGGSVDTLVLNGGVATLSGTGRIINEVVVRLGTFNLTGGTFGIKVTVEENGIFNMSGSTASTVDSYGSTTISGSADITTLNVTGSVTAMTDGTVTNATVAADGTLNISGGNVTTLAANGGTADITDGTVTTLAVNGGVATLSGNGTVENDVTVSSGTFNLNGGTFGNNVTVEQDGFFNMSDSTATVTTAGTSAISGGTATTVTSTGSTTISNSASVTTLNVNDGTTTVNGGTVATLNATAGNADITGGTVATLTVNGGEATLNGGTVSNDVDVKTGTFNLQSGTFGQNIIVARTAFFNMSGSTAAAVTSLGTTAISGGTVNSLALNAGSTSITGGTVSTLTVSGGVATLSDSGTVENDVTVSYGTFNLNGGTFGNDVGVASEGSFNMSGSSAAQVTTAGTTNITGGTVATVESTGTTTLSDHADVTSLIVAGAVTTVSGGTVGSATVTTDGELEMSNGTVTTVTNAGKFNFTGGLVAESVKSAGTTTISGSAQIGTLVMRLGSEGVVRLSVSEGTTTMSGGAIYGGDVGVEIDGYIFVMTGGTISGCGIGVNFIAGEFRISGTPIVTQNTQNVYLPADARITVIGALQDGAKLGVTLGTSNGFGTFTTGYDTTNPGVEPSTYFVSDAGKAVMYDAFKEAAIYEKHDHNHGNVDYKELLTGMTTLTSGKYFLYENFTGTLTINGNVELCLNGYVFTGNGDISIVVQSGTFTLVDCCYTKDECDVSAHRHGYTVGEDGKYVFDVNVVDSQYMIKGGVVTGGGIYVDGGEFIMNGGTIAGNNYGLYISQNATATFTNGTIEGNITGIYVAGEFTLNGGTITKNVRAVYIAGGSFDMVGGKISANKSGVSFGAAQPRPGI